MTPPPDHPLRPCATPPVLVGRAREEAVLRDYLAEALAGNGSLVLIGGEAGIGKTTLAEALCGEAAEQDALVLVGRCYDLTETPPYGPWIELFGRYRAADAMPQLPVAFAQRGTVGEVASQAALIQQVHDFLAAVAEQRPLVLLLDDMHWADPASLDLLRAVARSLGDLPLLALATYRADELTRRHPLYALLPTLVRETSAARIDLQRIDATDIHTLVSARYKLPHADVDRLVAYLDARSEGNPFFLGELLRTLETERVLRQSGEGWMLGDLTQTRVPALLRQVIDGRFARLGDDAQRLLAVAAVIGQEIPLGLWMAVTDTDEETLGMAVERAMNTQIIEGLPDGGSARFAHALIREALYEGIAPVRRRAWHRRVAEELTAMPNPDPDAVAHHFGQAGDSRAGEWLIRAGDRAQQAYALVTAAERYEAALAQMASDEATSVRGWVLFHLARMWRYSDSGQSLRYLDEAIRVALAAGDRPLAASALCHRGMVRIYLGELGLGVDEIATAMDEIEALSPAELDSLGRRSFASASGLVMVRGTLVAHMADVGRLAEARDMGERLLVGTVAPTEGAERSSAYGDGWHGLGSVYALLGMPDEARHAYARSQMAYQSVGHHAMRFFVYWIHLDRLSLPYHADRMPERQMIASEAEQARIQAASSGSTFPPHFASLSMLFVEGKWAEADDIARASLAHRRPIYARLFARRILGFLARERGEPETAWAQIREMFPDGPGTAPGGLLFREAIPFQQLATMLALDARDFGAARAWLEAQDQWLIWSGAVPGQCEAQLGSVAYYRARGNTARAYQHATQALAYATEPRQPLALLAAHRLLGELDTDARRFEDAQAHLIQSLALADACAAPFERALTLLALAELHAAKHERTEASALLEEVRTICTRLGAKPTLIRADALTTRLASLRDAPPLYPAGLSGREVEVLRLIAAGRTNRDIADALFLSANTVRIHVTHILEKTNTDNRAAAAAFAQRHGLA